MFIQNIIDEETKDIDLAADTLLETFDLGDIVTVTVEGYDSFEVPVCSNYDDVFMGEKLLRTVSGKTQLCLAINYGQLGIELGIIEKAPDAFCIGEIIDSSR